MYICGLQGVFLSHTTVFPWYSRDPDPYPDKPVKQWERTASHQTLVPSPCHFSWARFQKVVLNFSKVPQMNPLVFSNLQLFLFFFLFSKAQKCAKAFHHTLKDTIWVISWERALDRVKISVHFGKYFTLSRGNSLLVKPSSLLCIQEMTWNNIDRPGFEISCFDSCIMQ